MLILRAAREVVEEEGFDDLLDSVRDRIDAIESLHRTRELTVSRLLQLATGTALSYAAQAQGLERLDPLLAFHLIEQQCMSRAIQLLRARWLQHDPSLLPHSFLSYCSHIRLRISFFNAILAAKYISAVLRMASGGQEVKPGDSGDRCCLIGTEMI